VLRATILGLGVGTLCVTIAMVAVDLEAETWHSGRYRILRDLSHWAKLEPVQ